MVYFEMLPREGHLLFKDTNMVSVTDLVHKTSLWETVGRVLPDLVSRERTLVELRDWVSAALQERLPKLSPFK